MTNEAAIFHVGTEMKEKQWCCKETRRDFTRTNNAHRRNPGKIPRFNRLEINTVLFI